MSLKRSQAKTGGLAESWKLARSTLFGRVETKRADFVQIASLKVARTALFLAFSAKNLILLTYNQLYNSIFSVK